MGEVRGGEPGRPPRRFAARDKTVVVWDLNTGEPLARLALDGPVLCLSWHPDDPLLVAGDDAGNLYGLEYRQG